MASSKRIGQGLVIVAALVAYVTTMGATTDTSYQQHRFQQLPASPYHGRAPCRHRSPTATGGASATAVGATASGSSVPKVTSTTSVPAPRLAQRPSSMGSDHGGGNVNQVITAAQASLMPPPMT